MAGIFGLFDFTKEGPGIDPDEPDKGPFLEFFSIVGTKFWKLITINLMMILFHLPAIVIAFLAANWIMPMVFPAFSFQNIIKSLGSMGLELSEGVTMEAFASHLFISSVAVFTFSLVGLQFIVFGPAQTGFTYLMRNFSRREPCFIWMDFRDTMKSNWKQGLIHSLISAVLTVLMSLAYYYYGIMLRGSMLATVLRTVLLVCIIIFTIMQFYIYQLMITFELKLKDVYKNALLFTFVRLPSNFGVLLLCVLLLTIIPFIVVWLIPNAMATLIVLAFYIFLLLSFTLLLINFQANRAIYKYMLKPILDKEKAERQAAIMAEDEELLREQEEEEAKEKEKEESEDEESGEEVPEEKEGKQRKTGGQGVPSGAPA